MTPTPVRYRIRASDVHAHLFEVTVTVDTPDPAGQAFVLPTWIPGSYLIREFARHFVQVAAHDRTGPIRIVKTAKSTWQAAPAHGAVTMTAQVYAFDLSVRAAYLDATRAYFNGAVVFACPRGFEAAPCVVDIVPPDDPALRTWRVATTLPRIDAPEHGFGRYGAANYDELIDHPVEASHFDFAHFEAGGKRHEIAITGRHGANLARLTGDLERICRWQVELFGEAPFDRYLFQVTAVGDGYGGLEHRSSTSLLCRRDELPHGDGPGIDDDYLTFLGLASHEYFHVWNVKRIKPAAFVPYDLTQEAYTRQLWAFEGFTSYYDDLALVRSNVIAPDRYLELLGRALTTVLRVPGRLTQSVAESSFDAWIKFYRPDENTPNAVVSYYAKGSLVGLALDLELRSGGHASLDDLMRALWVRYGRPGIGVPEDAIAAIASELAGRDLSDFFSRYVHGTEDPPFAALLARFGVELAMRPASGPRDRGGKPSTAAAPRCTLGARVGPDQKLAAVVAGGPASRAGLSANDVLVAIDGLKATPERVTTTLSRYAPGEQVSVAAFRRDELMTFDVTLAEAPADTCYLTLARDVDEPTAARRVAWLGSGAAAA